MKHRATARDALSPAEVWVSAASRPQDMSAEIDAVGAVYAAVFEGDRWLGLVALHEAAAMGSERLFVDLLDKSHEHPQVLPDAGLEEVRRAMDEAGRDAAAVVEAGRYVGLVTRDSLAREESQHGREIAEERARTLFESTSDGILIIDPKGVIESANHAAETMFGYVRAAIASVPAIELIDHSFREEVEVHARKVRSRAAAEHSPAWWEPDWIEAVGQRADGSTFPAEMTLSPLPDEGFAVIVRDISRRKELERRLADAAVEERRLLAEDLHDGLSSQMAALGLYARNIRNRLAKRGEGDAGAEDDTAATLTMCDTLLKEIRSAHEEMRRLSHGLMPIEGGPEGLFDALHRLADRLRDAGGVEVEYHYENAPPIVDLTAATNLFQIAQEATHNALRHGEPRRLAIRLEPAQYSGRLVIEDDGKGISPNAKQSRGIGLRSMRHRAELIGGSLSIHALPAGGTRVCCRFPTDHETTTETAEQSPCSTSPPPSPQTFRKPQTASES